MKWTVAILSCIALIATAAAGVQYLWATGSDRLLQAIQRIQPGSTQDEVREIMGREPNVKPANDVPAWIEEVVPKNDTGEYWHFFMGYPPRNLIIYFDATGHVVYTTWTST